MPENAAGASRSNAAATTYSATASRVGAGGRKNGDAARLASVDVDVVEPDAEAPDDPQLRAPGEQAGGDLRAIADDERVGLARARSQGRRDRRRGLGSSMHRTFAPQPLDRAPRP